MNIEHNVNLSVRCHQASNRQTQDADESPNISKLKKKTMQVDNNHRIRAVKEFIYQSKNLKTLHLQHQ